jgi:hypothetical protein
VKNVSLLSRLNAIGSLVDGLIAELEEEDQEAAGSGDCPHPVDQREDLTTMGGPEGWRCRVCGFSTLTDEDNTTLLEEADNVSNSR